MAYTVTSTEPEGCSIKHKGLYKPYGAQLPYYKYILRGDH